MTVGMARSASSVMPILRSSSPLTRLPSESTRSAQVSAVLRSGLVSSLVTDTEVAAAVLGPAHSQARYKSGCRDAESKRNILGCHH
jgi:hypothetical protein